MASLEACGSLSLRRAYENAKQDYLDKEMEKGMTDLEFEVLGILKRNFPLAKSINELYYFEREYSFTDKHDWRFDFAFPRLKIAIEVNGGTYQKGGHSSGKGIHRDYLKLNYAQALGWAVFQLDENLCHREGYLVNLINLVVKERL